VKTAIRPTKLAQRKRLSILAYPSLYDFRFSPLKFACEAETSAAKGLDRNRTHQNRFVRSYLLP
jgi:hypothetical protein